MEQVNAIIFCDIDGCLNDGKHIALDLDTLAIIRGQIKTLAEMGTMLSLCTGRPQPYAEAIAQLLDLRTPFICEHGAMMFEPETDLATPLVAQNSRHVIPELLDHLRGIVGIENTHAFEPGNEYALCITGPGIAGESYAEIQAQMLAYQAKYSEFDVTWTYSNSAIDITPRGVTKQSGAAHFLDRYSLDASAAYAIGDSAGDLSVLNFVTHPMSPANAAPEVKKICRTIAKSAAAKGVVELLDAIIQHPNHTSTQKNAPFP